jgi:S-adenosylmethionine synthetase
VAAECAISTGILFVSIKARSRAMVDAPATARELLEQVGYVADGGFDPRTCTVMTSLHPLAEDRFQPVDEEQLTEDEFERVKVRDQATVFGFACKDTPSFMPLPIWLAHRLARRLAAVREELEYLSPDGKTQVAIEYRGGKAARIHGITLIACQRERAWPSAHQLEQDLRERVIEPVCSDLPVRCDGNTRIATNPEGPLVPGGPALHAGLTGRKTAVDGYGEFARGGASAWSGKDPSRIDRVGRYAAHHAARHVVACGLAERCEIALSYSIGLSRPVSVVVDSYGTGRVPDAEIAQRVARAFDFRPAAIIKRFGLRSLPARQPGFYRKLAVYGQVGRDDLDAPWERLDCLHLLC